MKTYRFIFILFWIAFMPILLTAQNTVYYQSPSQDIQKAKELYIARNYVSAINQFDRIAKEADENSEVRAEAMFYKALCGLKLDNRNADGQIAEFMNQFPESTFRNRASFELAIYNFDKRKFAAVLKSFEGFDKSKLRDRKSVV